jgi:hypothetical protein
LLKGLKEFFDSLLGNANTRISYGKSEMIAFFIPGLTFDVDDYFPLGCKLDGIANNVD